MAAPPKPNASPPPAQTHTATRDLGIPLILVLCFLVLYGWGASRTVQGADAAEFMLLAGGGGIAHPPGYPLFTAMVRLFHLAIPWGTAAWHASLAAAVLGASAVGVTYLTVVQLTRRPTAALVAACSLGFLPSFWQYSTVSEVFAGGVLGFALVAWCVAAIDGQRVDRTTGALLLGAACGLGAAHHHAVVLAAPLAAWGCWLLWAQARTAQRRATTTLVLTAGLLPGLVANLLLMLPGGAWRWGHTASWGGLIHHLLRRDYGTGKIAVQAAGGHIADNIEAWGLALLAGFLLSSLLGVAGLVAGIHRKPHRGYTIALALSLILAGPVFVSLFGLEPVGAARVLLTRFYLFSAGLFAIAIGLGAAAVLPRLGRAGPALLLGLLGLQLAQASQHRVSHRDWTVLDDYLRNSLEALEPGSLLVASGDFQVFPLVYLQQVEGVRPDVTVVASGMLGFPWYRQRLALHDPSLGLEGVAGGGFDILRALPALVEANLAHRPIYLSLGVAANPGLAELLPPMAPSDAIVMRLHPEGTPPPWVVEEDLRRAMAKVDMSSGPQTDHQWRDSWEAEAWRQHGIALNALAAAWRAGGATDQAERCERAAEGFTGP